MREHIPEPLLSVRNVTYRHVDYIAQCLDNVLCQVTNFPFEIVIGEDGSTDGAEEEEADDDSAGSNGDVKGKKYKSSTKKYSSSKQYKGGKKQYKGVSNESGGCKMACPCQAKLSSTDRAASHLSHQNRVLSP